MKTIMVVLLVVLSASGQLYLGPGSPMYELNKQNEESMKRSLAPLDMMAKTLQERARVEREQAFQREMAERQRQFEAQQAEAERASRERIARMQADSEKQTKLLEAKQVSQKPEVVAEGSSKSAETNVAIEKTVNERIRDFLNMLANTKGADGGRPISAKTVSGLRDIFEGNPAPESWYNATNSVECRIVAEHFLAGATFIRINSGIDQYDQNNPRHEFVAKLMADQGKLLEESPDSVRIREGKEFVSRHKFAAMYETNKTTPASYWTLKDNDVLQLVCRDAAASISKIRTARQTDSEKNLGDVISAMPAK